MPSNRGLLITLSSLLCTAVIGSLTEEGLVASLRETQDLLQQGNALVEDDTLVTRIDELRREIEGLTTLREDLLRKEEEVDRLVAMANARQIEGLIARLNDTCSSEIALRNLVDQSKLASDEMDESEGHSVSEDDYVNIHDLSKRFATQNVLHESETKLKMWVVDLINEELNSYRDKVLITASDSGATGERNIASSSSSEGCPSIIEVVQDVQVALNKFSQDGIGLVDHAQGAEVVYSMTSATYVPPAEDHELLGNVWWGQYIPEDWESLLPKGWEGWSVNIPSAIFHGLNIKGGKTSSPEAILEKKALPGACWPMEGSRGQVTLRLPYSIKVDSFTIDHVARSILPQDMHETAPKKLKVIAYPPCTEPADCGALGFDIDDPMEVAHLDYDIDGPSIQTFESVFLQAAKMAAALDDDEIDSELGDRDNADGSCSQEAAACSAPPRIDVAAITVKILENHGNPDYTCMYRFRAHGEQVL